MLTRFARLNPSLRGPMMMIGACAGFAAMMAIVRHVSLEISPLEAVFFRNLLGTVFILPLVFYAGWDQLHTGRPAMHLLRAVLGLIAMLLLFTALSLLPLADVTALASPRHCSRPSAPRCCCESTSARDAGRRRWWASAARSLSCVPAWAPSAGRSLIALASAVAMAAAQLSVKSLSRTEHPNAIVLIMGLLMTPMSLLPVVFVWTWPSWSTFSWLLLMGLAATAARYA